MPISQAHEQENAYVKGSNGCVELTENPTAFRYNLPLTLWKVSFT